MAGQIINDGFALKAPRYLDLRQGKIVNNKSVPYQSAQEIKNLLDIEERVEGLPMYVENDGNIEIWHFVGGINDSDLKKKEEGGGAELYTPITYAALKTLRDNGNLVAGMQYRITDFVTTVDTANVDYAQSAGHPFDVIVVADSANKLNENARAIRHEGDTYFPSYTRFEAWELKYCLDNDLLRFEWADVTNGKGVIWWMKDENQNEVGYDFKNVQFKRWAITDYPAGAKDYLIDVNYDTSRFGYKTRYAWTDVAQKPYPAATIGTSDWYFTLCDLIGEKGTYGTPIDQSTFINGLDTEPSSLESGSPYVYGNVVLAHGNIIKPCRDKIVVDDFNYQRIKLNNTVIVGARFSEDDGGSNVAINGNYIGYDNVDNTCFSGKFVSNTFGNDVQYNTFGNDVNNNTFGNYVNFNTFGNDVNFNTFGNYVQYNTFGNDVQYNTFGNDVNNNTFGNYVNFNTFGNDVNFNTFGNYVNNNTFGNDVQYNTFGNDLQYIDFGSDKSSMLIIKAGVKGKNTSRINIDTAIALLSTPPKQITLMKSATDDKYIIESRVSATVTEAEDFTV